MINPSNLTQRLFRLMRTNCFISRIIAARLQYNKLRCCMHVFGRIFFGIIPSVFGMNELNGSKLCICNRKNSAINKSGSVVQTSTKNADIKGDVHFCKYPKEAHSRSQTHDNIKDTEGKETACPCPRPSLPKHSSSQLETGAGQPEETQYYEKPEWLNCFMQGCQKTGCFDGVGFLPAEYPSPGKPCVPEYVRPHPPQEWNRRPQLPKPPEMLSTLKQGIRHPFQLSHRRKEMQTRLDKLTDEHEAFAYPSGTRPFLDNAYYSTEPASSLVQNYDLVRRDIDMQKFPECAIRPFLLALNRDKYKFFRERLPMPQKRILNIPGYRTTHWHNWTIRPLRTTYSESWRRDIKVPDNWFGPEPLSVS